MNAIRDFLRRSPMGRWGVGLVFLTVIAIAAPWLAPADPTAQNLAQRLMPPSAAHWMGRMSLAVTSLREFFTARVFRCWSA